MTSRELRPVRLRLLQPTGPNLPNSYGTQKLKSGRSSGYLPKKVVSAHARVQFDRPKLLGRLFHVSRSAFQHALPRAKAANSLLQSRAETRPNSAASTSRRCPVRDLAETLLHLLGSSQHLACSVVHEPGRHSFGSDPRRVELRKKRLVDAASAASTMLSRYLVASSIVLCMRYLPRAVNGSAGLVVGHGPRVTASRSSSVVSASSARHPRSPGRRRRVRGGARPFGTAGNFAGGQACSSSLLRFRQCRESIHGFDGVDALVDEPTHQVAHRPVQRRSDALQRFVLVAAQLDHPTTSEDRLRSWRIPLTRVRRHLLAHSHWPTDHSVSNATGTAHHVRTSTLLRILTLNIETRPLHTAAANLDQGAHMATQKKANEAKVAPVCEPADLVRLRDTEQGSWAKVADALGLGSPGPHVGPTAPSYGPTPKACCKADPPTAPTSPPSISPTQRSTRYERPSSARRSSCNARTPPRRSRWASHQRQGRHGELQRRQQVPQRQGERDRRHEVAHWWQRKWRWPGNCRLLHEVVRISMNCQLVARGESRRTWSEAVPCRTSRTPLRRGR